VKRLDGVESTRQQSSRHRLEALGMGSKMDQIMT
jgi:hypothetical protein